MNLGQLTGWIQQNKKPLAIAGAVGVGGLALMQRGKSGGGDAGGGPMVDAAPTSGAGARYGLTTGGGAYDSTASDVYNAIAPQLEEVRDLLNQQNKPPVPVVAPPKASTMYAPTGTGNYAWLSNGVSVEVQDDGSLFGMTGEQLKSIMSRDPNAKLSKWGSAPKFYAAETNARAAAQKAT